MADGNLGSIFFYWSAERQSRTQECDSRVSIRRRRTARSTSSDDDACGLFFKMV